MLLLSKFIYDHVLCQYDITPFACECYCAQRREDCCCIVLLTTLSPLDVARLSTRWLTAPLMAVGLLQPFRSSAQMHDDHLHVYIVFFYSIWAFILFYYCLYLSEVTNKVVQSINQFEQSCDTLPSHTIGVRGRRERDTYIYIYIIFKNVKLWIHEKIIVMRNVYFMFNVQLNSLCVNMFTKIVHHVTEWFFCTIWHVSLGFKKMRCWFWKI